MSTRCMHRTTSSYLRFGMPLLAALAMSYGWGFRGDYGHEAGAMFPGAFLALSILIGSGRADWLRRIVPITLAAALGWALGGAVSYGKVIGYTAHSSWPDVAYGYTSLWIIGALWGSVGAGCLALALTMKRSWLNAWAYPLILLFVTWQVLDGQGITEWAETQYVHMDVDWVAALSALLVGLLCYAVQPWRAVAGLMMTLAAGWLLGFFVLTYFFGLRMTPPRGDNWAGSVGLAVAFFVWLHWHRYWAAMYLFLVGAVAGGFGFALGDALNMMGRAGWGPVGELARTLKLDAWKWMEQSFGLIMGLGVALGVLRLVKTHLPSPVEDEEGGDIHCVGLVFLLVVMPWMNFFKNIRRLISDHQLGSDLFGVTQPVWYIMIGAGVSLLVVYAVLLHRRGKLRLIPLEPLGRAQLLFLFLMWLSVLAAFQQGMPHMKNTGTLWVHVTFWLTASAASMLALCAPLPDKKLALAANIGIERYRPGRWLWLLLILIPVVLAALTWATVSMHDKPLPGSHTRF